MQRNKAHSDGEKVRYAFTLSVDARRYALKGDCWVKQAICAFFILMTCFYTHNSVAENLDLKKEKDISVAKEISVALADTADKVNACIEKNAGVIEGCTCETREKCPFKAEFDNFVETFCTSIANYPEWRATNISYFDESDNMSHTIGTKNMSIHFGRYCEK